MSLLRGDQEQRYILNRFPFKHDVAWRRVIPRCYSCHQEVTWDEEQAMLKHFRTSKCSDCIMGEIENKVFSIHQTVT
jgi:hypothetical protein